MADITAKLPFPLSDRLASVAQNIFARQGREVDVAIGGIPFRLATSTDLPYSIETVQIRKEQIDTERDPGEQSLAGWWRRSQSSFHEGAGNLYQEDPNENADSATFYDSRGVDVFTKGRVTLLKKMVSAGNSNTQARLRVSVRDTSGTTWLSYVALGSGAYRLTGLETGSTANAMFTDASVVDTIIMGGNHLVIRNDNNFTFAPNLTGASPVTYPLGATPTRVEWGLHRPWVIGGNKIWQPDMSDPDTTAQSPIFTNPNTGWTYTCLAESPAGMLFGGHDGLNSSIQIVTLDAGGGLPTLTGATVLANLPAGELVQEIAVLGGFLVGIGTNRGFRVGLIDGSSLTYGPLIFEPDGITATTAIASYGRFFYVAVKATENLVYRVDTGTEVADGVFAYAADVNCNGLEITSLAVANGRVFATTSDGKRWHQSSTDYVSSGYLLAGRVRFRTTERKFFRGLQVEIEPLAGAMQLEAIAEGGSTISIANMTQEGATFDGKFAINSDPLRYLAMKFTMVPSEDLTETPVLRSYQLSAMPAVKPQRTFTVPLLCYDQEQSLSGQWYGGKDFAVDRYYALTAIEDQSGVVTYQDFSLGGNVGRMVTIESVRFVRFTASPASTGAVKGPGGVILLELRTAED